MLKCITKGGNCYVFGCFVIVYTKKLRLFNYLPVYHAFTAWLNVYILPDYSIQLSSDKS